MTQNLFFFSHRKTLSASAGSVLPAALPTDGRARLYLDSVHDMIRKLFSSDVRDDMAQEAISKVAQVEVKQSDPIKLCFAVYQSCRFRGN